MLIRQDLQQYYADIQEKAVQTKMTAETCYKFTSTTWGQGSPYNVKCPIKCDDNAPAGCVAIAIAQVLAYHKVPSTLNWSAILASDKTTSSSSTTVKNQVSTLIAEIGTKINMQYDCTESGANTADAPSLLHSYGLNSGSLIPFSILDCKYALENGEPTIMRGQNSGSTSGHAWVCDGWKRHIYDDATYYDYLSMNWGWDGSSNGFYLVENPISFSAGGHLFNEGFKIIHIYK